MWTTSGDPLDDICESVGQHLGVLWTTSGDPLDDIWGSFGRHLGIIWTTPGNDVDDICGSGSPLDDIWGSTGRHLGVNRATSGGSCGRHLAANWTTYGGHSSCTINVGIIACKHGHDTTHHAGMVNWMRLPNAKIYGWRTAATYAICACRPLTQIKTG